MDLDQNYEYITDGVYSFSSKFRFTMNTYLKKFILPDSSDFLHASANPPTSIIPQIAKANKATNITTACNASVHKTALSPP